MSYDTRASDIVSPSLYNTKMFVLVDPNTKIPPSLQLERQWSTAVEGLIGVKAPRCNTLHRYFFVHEENVATLANHLKLVCQNGLSTVKSEI